MKFRSIAKCFILLLAILSLTLSPLYPAASVYAADEASNEATGPTYGPQTPGITSLEFQRSNNSEFLDTACDPSKPSGPASGASTELTFPKDLDEGKMADAINKFVDENKGPEGSILEGVGEKAVASGKEANVNPFLVIAQAKHESEMGSKNNANVQNANNSFGRMATASQPHWDGARLWYKWSSGEASVDSSAAENKGKDYGGDQYSYIRKMFSAELDGGDWKAYFERYAPVSDNNANPIYHPSDGSKPLVQQEVEKMVADASGGGSSPSSGSSTTSSDSCCADASTAGTISGDTPAAKVMSYLTGKGLSVEVAAGFVGNFMQESGGGTFELNPTADNGTHRGIAQWGKGDRFARLAEVKPGKEDDLDTQIWYVGLELGLEQGKYSGGYKDALDYIKQATSAEDAAARVDEKYEISGGSALDARKQFAKQALDEYGDGAVTPATGGSGGSCGETKASGDFVYYNQNDPKWQGAGYDIASSGCGPTSIAMIIATKKDKKVTPVEVTKFLSDKGMWNASVGIYHSGFPAAGEEYGMKVTEIGTDWEKAKEALKAGKFLTLSGQGSAPYTSGGHIIVARDVTDDGKIVIANPAPMTDTPESTPYSTPIPGTAKMWIFE